MKVDGSLSVCVCVHAIICVYMFVCIHLHACVCMFVSEFAYMCGVCVYSCCMTLCFHACTCACVCMIMVGIHVSVSLFITA